ncbi:MAG: transposase [Deltaproteobacteria bacterium]|nr:transposase [Deltaproteobacteria bacterium]MBI3387282.1 transposase [Deltaproteobacteria bacterium]
MALPERKRPTTGVVVSSDGPTIVFVTVCTKDRRRWLATPQVHALLRTLWADSRAWRVGRYVLMPDHLHLFCAPGVSDISLARWVKYWKAQVTHHHRVADHQWQAGCWDTRLRTGESYERKWDYVRNNPVRQQLVGGAKDWPYQGELAVLPWY